MIESLSAAQHVWRDDPWQHDVLLHAWDAEVVKIPELAAHRAWIEEHQYGFGHRSFHWAWWLFAKEKSSGFKFLEVGVHKGQSLSAVDLAAHLQGKTCTVVGLSPFNGFSTGNYYNEEHDYEPDVRHLFDTLNGCRQPFLIRSMSSDPFGIQAAAEAGPYDGVYIDAEHSYEFAVQDLKAYMPMVKPGGYLFVDDSAMNLNLTGWHFRGFQGVSDAVDEILPPKTESADWAYVTNAMHLRIWRRK